MIFYSQNDLEHKNKFRNLLKQKESDITYFFSVFNKWLNENEAERRIILYNNSEENREKILYYIKNSKSFILPN